MVSVGFVDLIPRPAPGPAVPTPTRPLAPSMERIGVPVIDVANENAFTAEGIVVVEEFVKFTSPAFTVRRSACWSPIWREPRNPAFEKKVDEAMTESASVDASPMVVDPVLKRLVDMERTEVVANVEVDVRAKNLSNVDEAVRRIPTAVEVGRIANWDSNDQLEPDPTAAV